LVGDAQVHELRISIVRGSLRQTESEPLASFGSPTGSRAGRSPPVMFVVCPTCALKAPDTVAPRPISTFEMLPVPPVEAVAGFPDASCGWPDRISNVALTFRHDREKEP